MPSASFKEEISITGGGGNRYKISTTIQADQNHNLGPVGGVAPAKAGELTDRVDEASGELTIPNATDYFANNTRADLYDANGTLLRYGISVDTVVGNAVTFQGGSGGNLPVANSTLRLAVCHYEDYTRDATTITLIGLGTNAVADANFVFVDDEDGELANMPLTNQYSYMWVEETNVPHPLGEVTMSRVYMSHGDLVQRNMFGDIFNN